MPTLQYPNNPNTDTAFVVQDDGTKNRALMTAPQDTSTLELPSNPNSTKGYVTIDGKKQRVVLTADISGGGSGGDQHNLGWYATESALTTAHPTAEAGDWAIVGSTDTVWVWDTDTTAWKDTGAAGIELPDQTGNAGKFLVTNGTSPSWGDALTNTATGTNSLTINGTAATEAYGVNIGNGSTAGWAGVAIGYNCKIGNLSTGIGKEAEANVPFAIAIGNKAKVSANYAIQLGGGSNGVTNSDANTFKVANENGNFEIMSADGTIPADRLVNAVNKYSTMPTAASTNKGWIVQFTGTTDSTYTHGHLYECVSDGQTPATYSWEEISFGSGGGLPSQTGNSGKFLTTDGTDASWGNALANTATGTNSILTGTTNPSSYEGITGFGYGVYLTSPSTVAVGYTAYAGSSSNFEQGGVAIGALTHANKRASIAIGYGATVNARFAIQLNASYNYVTNSDANTFKVANDNGNFTMMDANGNLPADRLASTTGLADGNYRLRLTMANGVPTLSWVAE